MENRKYAEEWNGCILLRSCGIISVRAEFERRPLFIGLQHNGRKQNSSGCSKDPMLQNLINLLAMNNFLVDRVILPML